MRIFITGGTGFIGAHVINGLIKEGLDVYALRRLNSSPPITLFREPEWITGDLTGEYHSELSTTDTLVHLAASGVIPTDAAWGKCFSCNVIDSVKLWKQAVECGVRRFIIFGSCFEYGSIAEQFDRIPTTAPLAPIGPYSASKAAASMAAIGLAQEFNLEVMIIRPFHVYGEGEKSSRFWPSLKQAALSGSDFDMTLGEQIRDFTPVGYVAERLVKILKCFPAIVKPGKVTVTNMGTGNPVTLKDFAESQWGKYNATGDLRIGAKAYRPHEVMRYVPEIDPIICM